MLRYVVRRLLGTIPALLAASLVIFLAIHIVPGRASTAALGLNPTPEARAAFEARHGLDRPLPEQYVGWLFGAVRGDFGHSIQNGSDISAEIRRRLPVTLELTTLALVVALVLALPLGTVAAERRGRAVDLGTSIASLIGVSIPSFVTATILILVVALGLRWVPPGGYVPLWEKPIQNLQLMALPAISLGVVSSSLFMRIFRVSLIETLSREYVQATRAKGADEWRVLRVHAFRNAAIPLITVGAMEVAAIFGGSVIVEKIFQLPGIGSYVLYGIESRDFGLLQAAALTITTFVLLANLAVDLIAAWLDPRLRRFA